MLDPKYETEDTDSPHIVLEAFIPLCKDRAILSTTINTIIKFTITIILIKQRSEKGKDTDCRR